MTNVIYKEGDVLFTSPKTIIQKVIRVIDGREFITKKPLETIQVVSSMTESFRKDFQYTSLLHQSYPNYFPQMVEMVEQKNGSIFLVESFEGESLKSFLTKNGAMNLESFLPIAKEMATAIHYAHSKQLLHRDIKLDNFMIKDQQNIKLIDFGISVMVTRKSPSVSCSIPTGTISYMSPEQTGRVAKNADFKSDIYSLGICFYELLTKSLPFVGDRLTIVHSHISKKLPNLMNVPAALNDIIQKMCAKNPSDRYLSAFGVLKDLEFISENLSNIPESFTPGLFDVKEFQIPNILYGREKELSALKNAILNSIAQNMCLVSGLSGMGKSALVDELLKDQNLNLLMAYGKFDQFNRLTPYSAFLSTIQSLVRRVLSDGDVERENFTQLLNIELNEEYKNVLNSMVPEVELLLGGSTKIVEALGTTKENQERLFEAFLKFYGCFTGENTLVLALDDLQWADAASFEFLEKLLSLKNNKIFIIGAYRDNEVGDNHPLKHIINENKTISIIHLQPLKLEDLNKMVADTLNTIEEKTLKLSELIHKKTLGNPFFSREFINTLYQEELIFYENKSWNWNIEKVEKMNFSSNVIDFMIKNLKKKPKTMQKFLNRASCIGNSFKIDELKWIWDEASSIENELIEPLKEGWIHQINSNEYKFFHDRLQQASYELFEKEKEKIHSIIGKILLEKFEKLNLIEKNIFNILNHLNKSTFEDKNELLRLNLIAAKKSLDNSAYSTALKFSSICLELLPKNSWEVDYENSFETYSIHSETLYANQILEQSEHFYDLVLEKSVGRLHKLKVVSKFSRMLSLTNKKDKAYILLIEVYKMFDLTKDIPFDDIGASLEWTIDFKKKIDLEVGKRGGYENIVNLANCDDVEIALLLTTMFESMDTLILAKTANPIITITTVLVGLYLFLTEGLAHNAPVGLAFAGWIYSFFFLAKEGHILTSASEKLLSKDQNPRYNVVAVHNPIGLGRLTGGTCKDVIYHEEAALRIAMTKGEYVFGGYGALHSSSTSCFNGDCPYPKLLVKIKKRQNWLIEINNSFNADFLEVMCNFVSDLAGISEYNPKLLMDDFITRKHADCFKPIFEGILQYHKGNFIQALNIFDAVESVGEMSKGFPDYYERKLYHGLTMIHQYNLNRDSTLLERIHSLLKDYEIFGSLGPDYLLPRHKFLTLYLQSVVDDDKMKVLNSMEELYEESSQLGLLILSAVISEIMLKICEDNKFPKSLCRMYFENSYKIWKGLAAKRKEEQMRQKYFKYVMTRRASSITTTTTSTLNLTTTVDESNFNQSDSLDMMSIIKSSQALSVELTIANLISKVLSIIIENTGAQNGSLFLQDGNEEFLEISMNNGKEKLIHKNVKEIKENELYCSLLLKLSKTMRKAIVINDVKNSNYRDDQYLSQRGVKSLCIHPIFKKNVYIGSVYLEHLSLEGAFDEKRKEILEHISTQLAISYENARLYEDMNSLNKSYERFLPKEFLQQLGKGDVRNVSKGDAETKNISILFSDIRSFTDITEKMNPKESFSFVNEILSYLAPIISKHNGFIDKFFGDCIMALFPNEVDDSIKCGHEMLKALKVYNQNCRKGLDDIKIGIGIHYGTAMIGTIGAENRIDATVISDAVNIASRVESLTKSLGATFLVTESVIQHSTLNYNNRYIGKYLLKGKEIPISLFQMLADDTTLDITNFTHGIQNFESGKFEASEKIFASLSSNDTTAKYLENVSNYFGKYSFDSSWSGEIQIDKDGNLVELKNNLNVQKDIDSLKKEDEEEVWKILKNGNLKDLLKSWSQNDSQSVEDIFKMLKK